MHCLNDALKELKSEYPTLTRTKVRYMPEAKYADSVYEVQGFGVKGELLFVIEQYRRSILPPKRKSKQP